MRIVDVTLGAADLPAQRAFYVETLGLAPVEDNEQSLAFKVGWSTLRFEQSVERPAPAHFAFNVPPDALDRAQEWLASRATLLAEDGEVRFDFPSWNARAVYAFDGDGNIIELIARRRLPDRLHAAPFSAAALLCVSEIGIVVDDPASAGREVCESLGLSIFSGAAPDFATVGDDEGLLIIVPPDRPWKPTADILSRPAPARITLSRSGRPGAPAALWEAAPYSVRMEAS